MKVIATKQQVDSIILFVKDFGDWTWRDPTETGRADQTKQLASIINLLLENGWGDPDENGVRQPEQAKDREQKVGIAAPIIAGALTAVLNDREAVRNTVGFTPDEKSDGGSFRTGFHWLDPDKKFFFDLVQAWSERRAIGRCQICGNIFVPGRGRTAKFCSTKCRVQAHREGA